MLSAFHEKEYDGIVLKIPSWFIKLNELEKPLEEFYKHLNASKFSMLYRDHLNNLHEIENQSTKKKFVDAERERIKQKQQERDEREAKILSGEIYELEWKKENRYLDYESFNVKDESFDWDDYFTNKCNIKNSFTKRFKELVKTYEDLYEFAKNNCNMLRFDLLMCNPNYIDMDYSFYTTTTASLGITYKRLNVRYDVRRVKNNNYSKMGQLIDHEDGCLGINWGGEKDKYKRLEGYVKKGMILVKE